MSQTLQTIQLTHVQQLMAVELACHSHPWSEKTLTSCIGGRYFGEVLTIADSIIGFYIGEYVAGEATLMNVCVVPTQQGKGYGKQLLLAFSAQAKQLGATTLFLEVRASNISAQMLYINAGFSQIARRTAYYPKAVGYEDAIVMRKNC
jgi:[ribosomal protein S18]-alanine N-acetyltransferase